MRSYLNNPKARALLFRVWLGAVAAFGLAWAPSTRAAATDGTMTFRVTTTTYGGGYAPRHILAIWVTESNATTNFIRTLEYRTADTSRRTYLYNWNTARAGSLWITDGISGATLSSHTTHNVTWNCKTTNGVTVPDGTYRLFVEFTESNGAGRLLNTVSFVKGTTALTNYPANSGNFNNMMVTYTPSGPIPPDLAVTRISPSVGNPNTTIPVQITVTNAGTAAGFTVVLSNLTSMTLIGTNAVSSLAGSSATNITINWNTAGLTAGNYQLKAVAGPATGEVSVADNALTNTITLRTAIHDVDVSQVNAPALILPNLITNVVVTVTNAGDYAETFGLTLTDETAGRLLGSNQVANLAALAASNITFAWNVTNTSYGNHTLRAAAAPVSGETSVADNTNWLTVLVAQGLQTNTYIGRSNVWRYHDQGMDLTVTPWKQVDYYDAVWPAGRGPFGYAYADLTTTNSYGPYSTNKYPTYYYRRLFNVDTLPISASGSFRRDDGLVIYLNGLEVFRTNMPNGPISYTNYANFTVSSDGATFYPFTVDPTNFVLGQNLVAVEVHQVNATSSDIAFDLELKGIAPMFPATHNVAAIRVDAPGTTLVGDRVPVLVTFTNRGNVMETATVYLRDTNLNQVVASQTISNLAPGATTTVALDWSTLNLTPGAHTLQAYTVVAGVTNLAGAGYATSTVASGLGVSAVNVAGSLGGRCLAAAANPTNLFVGAGATLEIYNRSNPAAPVKLSSLRLPGLIEDLVVAGSYVYAACGNAGVQIINIANPAAPVHTNTIASAGYARRVAIGGFYLFIADGGAGLRVVYVSNPAAPVFMAQYPTEGPAAAVVLSSPTAYLLDQAKGLQVLNITTPSAPALLGAYTNVDAGLDVAVSGSTVYVVDGNGRLLILNAATPSAPVLAGSLLLGTVGQSVAVSGTTAYVAAGDTGLLTINATTPTNLMVMQTNASSGQALDLAVSGTWAFLANGFAGFQVYDLTSPTAPALRGEFATSVRAADVVAANGLTYVAAGETGLRIYNTANPATPVWLGTFAGALNARCVAVSGTTAYVGDGQYGVKIVNVANPASPVLLGSYASTNLGLVRSIGVTGTQVVLTDGRKICLLDASNPAAPVLSATYDAPAFAYALAVAGNKAYVACGNYGLLILNVSASSLSYAGAYDTSGLASGVAVSGNLAYVADGATGWLILDIANPSAPALVKAVAAQGPVVDVAVSGTLALLGNGLGGAQSMDVSAPLTPVPQQAFGPLVRALRVAAAGANTYVAEDEAGLGILSVGGGSGDSDQDGLPDSWEQQIVDANPNDNLRTLQEVLPGDDFDRDGLTNYEEFLAGTSPLSAASVFAAVAPAVAAGSPVTIRWYSIPGKTYTVYKATDLRVGFSILQDNLTASSTLSSFTDANPTNRAFYLIRVR